MFNSLTLRQRLLAIIVLSGGAFLIFGLLYILDYRNTLIEKVIMLENSQQSRHLANAQLTETDQVASASNQMAASSAEMAEHADATL